MRVGVTLVPAGARLPPRRSTVVAWWRAPEALDALPLLRCTLPDEGLAAVPRLLLEDDLVPTLLLPRLTEDDDLVPTLLLPRLADEEPRC